MYFDDRFDPNLDNDVSVPDVSETETVSSVDTFIKKQRKNYEDMKAADEGYHKEKRFVNGQYKTIEFYSTAIISNALIRDAMFGSRQQHFHVGTSDELLFFKVAVCNRDKKSVNREPVVCFFDSPEQFEKHMGSSVSQETKKEWSEKNLKERLKRH